MSFKLFPDEGEDARYEMGAIYNQWLITAINAMLTDQHIDKALDMSLV